MSQDAFYITTPIYYVNDQPHIGHAYTTILADVLARYHRLLGQPTFFLTGTDEHGQKVARAAREAGCTPREQADRTVVRFQDLWRRLEITHDDFIRTTEDRHQRVVRACLQDLYDRGEIYRAEYDGWYCTPCERFFMEKDLADGNCPECGRAVEQIREANYFFRMGQYRDWLVDYIETHPNFIQPDFRRNETLGFLRQELNDLCISRPKSRLAWGIELPFDADYVCYVWFDALVNYISAIGYGAEPERFARWWPASYHLIGKDILTTHTVYWPTMLHALGVPMPQTIFAHGWWLLGANKMSKSLGNVVNPMEMAERYGVDPFRYFLMAEMTLGQDATFSEEAFIRRYNSDLANDLGNLQSRILKLLQSKCGGCLPPCPPLPAAGPEKDLWEAVQQAVRRLHETVLGMRLDLGLAEVLQAVRAINRYLEVKQPWRASTADPAAGEPGLTLYVAAEALRVAATLLLPVMPGQMMALRQSLGLGDDLDFARLSTFGVLKPGTPVAPPAALFPRLQSPAPSAPAPATQPLLTYDDFARLDLRTATILSAEPVPGADKLLKLQVDLGTEQRQIVAGIAQAYQPADLLGRQVVVVANLAPAKIRGIVSEGMLLAAGDGKQLCLVGPAADGPAMAPGARVK